MKIRGGRAPGTTARCVSAALCVFLISLSPGAGCYAAAGSLIARNAGRSGRPLVQAHPGGPRLFHLPSTKAGQAVAAVKAVSTSVDLRARVERIAAAKSEADRRQAIDDQYTGSRVRPDAPDAGTALPSAPAVDEKAGVNEAAPATGPPRLSRSRRVTFVYDAGARRDIAQVHLKGSFDKRTGAYDAQWGGGDRLPMAPAGDGKWTRTVELADDGAPHDWRWGAEVETPRGSQWGILEEEPLPISFAAEAREQSVTYAPTTYHAMGAHREGADDLAFRVWAPGAAEIQVKIIDRRTLQERRVPMRSDNDGLWSAALPGQWSRGQGDAYVYEITTGDGEKHERGDPYARVMQGKQRGISHLYVDAETGEQVEPYHFQHARRPQAALAMFEIQERHGERLAEAYLILKDENGRPLGKDELAARLGMLAPDFAARLRGGRFDDYWAKHVELDGRIRMTYEEGAWITLVNDPERLVGLRYELRAFAAGPDGLVELPRSAKNDPWSDRITPASGKSFRGAVVAGDDFDWKWDSVPRETDHNRWLIYQMHVGSVFGRALNSRRSTFDDVRRELGYVKDLGWSAIEFLPTNETEDVRDWRYNGANSLAVESSYGFEDEDGRWISGTEALKRVVDEAHRLGLAVVGDVVYNHSGGKYDERWQVSATDNGDNFLRNYDGKADSFFNWSGDPGRPEIKRSLWGPIQAFNNPRVRQFNRDSLGYQFQELHFDGDRFDFTEPIKSADQGGADGWFLLRWMNRLARFVNPAAYTAAEQFPYDASMTELQEPGGFGAGFTQTWYTEFNHRLVHEADPSKPGLLQEAARGAQTVMDRFMDLLVMPWGLSGWATAVAPITDHDEVGNGDRLINIANNGATDGLPSQSARNMARFALGLGLMSPGVPMIFQGEEFLADNRFSWGNPSTWDLDWSWRELGADWDWGTIRFNDRRQETFERLLELSPGQRESDPEYAGLSDPERKLLARLAATPSERRAQVLRNAARRLNFEFTKAAAALRRSSPAFNADAPVERVYTSNADSVLAFTRRRGDDEFLVVGSLNRGHLSGYRVELPPGQWRETFNSDAEAFGGTGFGNGGKTVAGGPAELNIPAMGYVVFKKAAP